MHKTTILCQFGLFCHQLPTISPPILNHFWWELYQTMTTFQLTSQQLMSQQCKLPSNQCPNNIQRKNTKSPLKGLHSKQCQFGKIKQPNKAVQQVQDFIIMLASHSRCHYVMSNMTMTCNCLVNLSLKLDAETSFL